MSCAEQARSDEDEDDDDDSENDERNDSGLAELQSQTEVGGDRLLHRLIGRWVPDVRSRVDVVVVVVVKAVDKAVVVKRSL